MSTATLTGTPVATTSELWPVFVTGMGEAPKPREKAAPTGEVTYSSGTILRRRSAEGALKVDKSASIHVLKPAAIYELGQVYEAKGRVYVMPYEANSRVALSITVEELVPVREQKAQASQ